MLFANADVFLVPSSDWKNINNCYKLPRNYI